MDRIALSRPNISDDEIAAASRTLRSGWLVYGAENRAFEEELAAYCGRRYAATVSSGTAALHLSLLALGGAPQAVLVPAFTFPATANVSCFLPTPSALFLADVEPNTFCLPAATVSAWLSAAPAKDQDGAGGRGPCLIVHQFGYPAPLPALLADKEALIISDAACAIGVPGAMRGRAVCLSFHPRKLLTTGEGGAVLSDDLGFIEEVRRLRAHGLTPAPPEEVMTLDRPGLNYRLPEVSAAVGRVQLRRLPGFVVRHRELAARYRQILDAAGLGITLQADHLERIYQTMAVVLPPGANRFRLRQAMLQVGVETQIASYGLHRLSAFASAAVFGKDGEGGGRIGTAAALPVSEQLHNQALALPLHSEMTIKDVDRVCEILVKQLENDRV